MPSPLMIAESHRSDRLGWLRAAVLGANDGIVSTASLILGVTAANSSDHSILITGLAGLVAGAMSMASGEYVSVSSQADSESADMAREKAELASDIDFEREELAQIYVGRGLTPALAKEVEIQMMAFDALGTHAREELGISKELKARPIQAALASGGAFSIGAIMPLLVVLICPRSKLILFITLTSILFLVTLGIIAARTGGSSIWKGALRVGFWGAFAMAITAAIGALFGTIV